MDKVLFLFLGTMLLLLHYLVPCLAMTGLAVDETALLALKSHLNSSSDDFGLNWSTDISCCNWTGITCGSRHQRVTALNVSNMDIVGTIPPHLGNLSFLTLLDIRNNSFFGELPEQLSFLRRLKVMDLRSNKFNVNLPSWFGEFPQLQRLLITHNSFYGNIPLSIYNNMSSLRFLDLGDNNFSGSLPADMCDNFPQLDHLLLRMNQLDGPIPSNIQKCRQLQFLTLSLNTLSGSIPKEIGNLTMLTELYLYNNKLSGSIPKEIGKLALLTEMNLDSNELSGSFPKEIRNLTMLTRLYIRNNSLDDLPQNIGVGLVNLIELYLLGNKLSGTIPSSISNASMLTMLDLSDNSFTGFIPDTLGTLQFLQILNLEYNSLTIDSSSQELWFLTSLTRCRNLKELKLSDNQFDGILPISVGNFSSALEFFRLQECNIKGHIPIEIGNISNLISLKLDTNMLSGSIPVSVGKLKMLQAIGFAENSLEGHIPYDLCGLKGLAYLNLNGNKLSGPIPTCIGNLTSLLELRLDANKLTSTIPFTLGNITRIVMLNLSSNSLSGNLPSEIGGLKAVTQIDLSDNSLSGYIPTSIGNLQTLINLSLAHNKLQGVIPPSFEYLISLEFLDLSDNNLSGTIPVSLEKLIYFKFFNVSSNKLSGEIPNGGSFLNFSAKSFMLNDELCGAARFKVPPCKNSTSSSGSRETIVLLLKYVLPAAVIIVVVLIFVLVRCRKNSEMTTIQKLYKLINFVPLSLFSTQTESSLPNAFRRISYKGIVEATNGFNEYNLLGKGSFGNVYKAIFSDGEILAIKVFNLQIEGAFKSFGVECEVLRNIRHRNLIKVISSCSNNDHDFKALVLEYMPNGNLDKWLYSHNYYLNIPQRLNIMIDVALALEYLHHGYTTPIVHCDLKPSNILLDVDMVAHVGDFGISKLFGTGDFMRQTMTLATVGYMAPEYGTNGIVSTKCDVYSYGIMLMETFTRKKPTDEYFTEEMNIKVWVRDSLPDSVTEVADSNLLRSEDKKQHFIAKKQCISSILALALDCCADSPEKRIDMKDIGMRLVNIRKKYFP